MYGSSFWKGIGKREPPRLEGGYTIGNITALLPDFPTVGPKYKTSRALPGVMPFGRSQKKGYRSKRMKTNPYSMPKALAGTYRKSGYWRPQGMSQAQELKFKDVGLSKTDITQAGQVFGTGSLITIPSGTGESQRVGRKVWIKNIGFRFTLNLPGVPNGVAGISEVVRMILYLDKQCNGVTALPLDILEDDDYQGFNNLSNKERFTIMMDKRITLNRQATGSSDVINFHAEISHEYNMYKKCYIPVEYSGTDGTIDEIRSNNIGLVFFSKVGAVADFHGHIRFRFTDNP